MMTCKHGLFGENALAVRSIYDRTTGPTFWIINNEIVCCSCEPTFFCQHSRYKGKCVICRLEQEKEQAVKELQTVKLQLYELQRGEGDAKKRRIDAGTSPNPSEGN